jgi:endoglucanase
VTVADGRIVVPWRLVDSLEQAAAKAGIACQRKLPPYGGTNAGAIHQSRGGVPTAVLSVPTRYIHTPVSLLRLDDLTAMLELTLAWLEEAASLCEPRS